jgi:hypothetical protein
MNQPTVITSIQRVISPLTLQRLIRTGKFQQIIKNGYIFNSGCGKFTKEPCTCNLCARNAKPVLNQVLSSLNIDVFTMSIAQ